MRTAIYFTIVALGLAALFGGTAYANPTNCGDLLLKFQHQPNAVHRAYDLLQAVSMSKDEFEKTDSFKTRVAAEIQAVNLTLVKEFGSSDIGAIVPISASDVKYDADKEILSIEQWQWFPTVPVAKFNTGDLMREEYLRYIPVGTRNENWEKYVVAFDGHVSSWFGGDSKLAFKLPLTEAKIAQNNFSIFVIGSLRAPYIGLSLSDAHDEEPFNIDAIGKRLATKAVIIEPHCMGVVNTGTWKITPLPR